MIYNSFNNKLNQAYTDYYKYIQNNGVLKFSKSLAESSGLNGQAILPYYSIQNIIRPAFGKVGHNEISIGDHPDFKHLKDTSNHVFSPITTMIMDIEGSTRLNLFYSLLNVMYIKNALLCATIEIVKAFDGHVHRIMGDSVMAYFGSVNDKPENGVINSINCSATLRYFVDTVVIPNLNIAGYQDDFGIRIGLDHGKKDDVLWSSYGYSGISEVTATSFYVDVASKLQNNASKNEILIGESLKQFMDFPESLLKTKVRQLNYEKVPDLYVNPNYTNKQGQRINYKKYSFDWKEYLKYTPIGLKDKPYFYNSTTNLEVNAEVSGATISLSKYVPSSIVLPKDNLINFSVSLPYEPRYPYKVKFSVENHGNDAGKHYNNDNHEKVYTVNNRYQHNTIKHTEHTAYRGFHYLNIEVFNESGSLNKACIGVYIE